MALAAISSSTVDFRMEGRTVGDLGTEFRGSLWRMKRPASVEARAEFSRISLSPLSHIEATVSTLTFARYPLDRVSTEQVVSPIPSNSLTREKVAFGRPELETIETM